MQGCGRVTLHAIFCAPNARTVVQRNSAAVFAGSRCFILFVPSQQTYIKQSAVCKFFEKLRKRTWRGGAAGAPSVPGSCPGASRDPALQQHRRLGCENYDNSYILADTVHGRRNERHNVNMQSIEAQKNVFVSDSPMAATLTRTASTPPSIMRRSSGA